MNEQEITIRAATADDVPAMSELMCDQARRFAAPDCTAAGLEMLLESLSEAAIQERMQGEFKHWIAVDAGSPVGVITLREPAHLYHLFVAEGRRGNGIGAKLWRHLLEVLTDGTREPVEITVRSTSFARRFYERMGFDATGAQVSENGVASYPMSFVYTPAPSVSKKPA